MPNNQVISTKMTFKELLDLAIEELKELTQVESPDFRLEQAEFEKSKGVWHIVVSFLVENVNKRILNIPNGLLGEFKYFRIYKKLKINNQDREVIGLYMFNNEE